MDLRRSRPTEEELRRAHIYEMLAGGAGGGPRLPIFSAAVAQARAGLGVARAFFVGDSATRGVNAVIAGTDCAAQSYPWQLAALLEAGLGVTCRPNQSFLGSGGMSSFSWGDARVTTDMTTLSGAVGAFFRAPVVPGTWDFNPGFSWTHCDIYFTTTTTLRFTYTVGVGAPVEPSISGALAPVKFSFSKAAGSEALSLDWVAGDFRLVGVHLYNTNDPCIQIHNVGVAGSTAATNISTAAGTGGAHWPAMFTPHLAVIDFGLNDYVTNVVPETFAANVQTNIDHWRAAGADVILKTFTPRNSAGTYPQSEYAAIMRSLARNNNLLLVDVFASPEWPDYATANANGLFSDGVHPSTSGYADIAGKVAATILGAVR